MNEIRTAYLYYGIIFCPIMKPLRLSSITFYIRTYAAFYTLELNAITSYHFVSQPYERDYVIFRSVETDIKHAPIDAIHATHLSYKRGNHLDMRGSTPHFTAVIIALHLF